MAATKKTAKKVAKLKKTIRKSNADFSKATLAQKRVIIAKDVLASLKAGRYRAKPGGYFYSPSTDVYFIAEKPLNTKLDKIFQNMPTCYVCALGACFVSAVKKFDGLTVGDVTSCGHYSHSYYSGRTSDLDERKTMTEKLSDFFETSQLDMIETAFEGIYLGDYGDYGDVRAYNFYHRRRSMNSDDRLKAIMQNIVDNNGTFVPPSKFDDPLSKYNRDKSRAAKAVT